MTPIGALTPARYQSRYRNRRKNLYDIRGMCPKTKDSGNSEQTTRQSEKGRECTGEGDVDLESAAFVRGADRTGYGADQTSEVVGFRAHPDARRLEVLAAFLELLLHPAEVDHLRPQNGATRNPRRAPPGTGRKRRKRWSCQERERKGRFECPLGLFALWSVVMLVAKWSTFGGWRGNIIEIHSIKVQNGPNHEVLEFKRDTYVRLVGYFLNAKYTRQSFDNDDGESSKAFVCPSWTFLHGIFMARSPTNDCQRSYQMWRNGSDMPRLVQEIIDPWAFIDHFLAFAGNHMSSFCIRTMELLPKISLGQSTFVWSDRIIKLYPISQFRHVCYLCMLQKSRADSNNSNNLWNTKKKGVIHEIHENIMEVDTWQERNPAKAWSVTQDPSQASSTHSQPECILREYTIMQCLIKIIV